MEYKDFFKEKTLEKLNQKSAANLRTMLGNKSLMQTVMSSQKLLGEIAAAEAPYKKKLEALAVNIVKELYPIVDEEGIKLDARIVSMGEVSSTLDEIKIDANTKLRLKLIFGKDYKDKNGYIWKHFTNNTTDVYYLSIAFNSWTSSEDYYKLNPKDFHPKAYRDAYNTYITINKEYVQIVDEIDEIKIKATTKLKLKKNKEAFTFSKEYTQIGTQYVWGDTENVDNEFVLLDEESGLDFEDYEALDPKTLHPRAYWDSEEHNFIRINAKYIQIIDEVDEIKIETHPKPTFPLIFSDKKAWDTFVKTWSKQYTFASGQELVDFKPQLFPFEVDEVSDTTLTRRYLNEALSPESRRRITNAITQGSAVRGSFAFYLFKEHLDDLDPQLVEKYNQILKNTFGIYDDDNAIAMLLAMVAQGANQPGGSSKVIINEIKIDALPKLILTPHEKNEERTFSYLDPQGLEWYSSYNNDRFWVAKYVASNTTNKGQKYSNLDPKSIHPRAYKKDDFVFLDPKYIQIKGELDENLNEEETGITIQARAICFPMLLHELVKGLYELISLHAFKGDKAANQRVVDKVDTLKNEPEDLRYGKFIYDALNDVFAQSDYSNPKIREFFFQEVYQLDDEDFISFVENAINEELSPRQQRWVDDTLRDIDADLRADARDATL